MHRPQLRCFATHAPRSGWQVVTLVLLLLLPAIGAWRLSVPVARAKSATTQTVTLAVTDGYDTKLGKRLSEDGKVYTVQTRDDDYWDTEAGYFTAFEFQGGIPAQATIHAVQLVIDHYEEKGITGNALRWEVGGGALQNPTVFASQRATTLPGEKHEQRVEWDVTAWLNTPTLINDLKLVIRNEDRKGKKTRLNQLFVVVVYTSGDDPAATNTATATQTATTTPTAPPTATSVPTDPPQATASPTDPETPATPGSPSATATPTPFAPVKVAITKSAYLFHDADGDEAVSPSDLLFYEIKLVNQEAATAPEMRLEDRPDPNTRLIPGSVRAIWGVIVQGNGAEDVSVVVHLEPLPSGVEAAVSFRVRVEPAPGVTHLQNQAWASLVDQAGQPTGQAPLASDDPMTASPNDPTTTPLGGVLLPSGSILFLPLIQPSERSKH